MPGKLTKNCSPVTNPFWASKLRTVVLTPKIKVTGFGPATTLFKQALDKVAIENPSLYDALGTAGMLCNRHVRGSPKVLSNHALGMAIDFTVHGVLDSRGDNKVLRGMQELYSIFKTFGLYWGAGFGVEDAMHFEVGYYKIMEWVQEGLL